MICKAQKFDEDESILRYNFSTTLNLALRLLALTLISSSVALIGFRFIILTIFGGFDWLMSSGETDIIALPPTVGSRDSGTPANFLNCFLTMASSKEWNVIIAKRPPGLSISMAWGITRSMTPSSSLVAILTAWNALVAGWIFSRFPGGFPKALTSSNVVSIGFSIRRSQTLLAKSFQCLSPP